MRCLVIDGVSCRQGQELAGKHSACDSPFDPSVPVESALAAARRRKGAAPTYTPSSEGRGRVRAGRTVGRLGWEEPSVLVPVHCLLLLVGFEVSGWR